MLRNAKVFGDLGALKRRKIEIIKYKLINDKGNAYTIVKISIHKER